MVKMGEKSSLDEFRNIKDDLIKNRKEVVNFKENNKSNLFWKVFFLLLMIILDFNLYKNGKAMTAIVISVTIILLIYYYHKYKK